MNMICVPTTMLEIVDKTGCTVKKLILPKEKKNEEKSPHHLNLMLGLNYIQDDKSTNESFLLNYRYKNSSFKLQTNNYENGGQGDTTLGVYYKINANNQLSYTLGASFILPTYDNQFNNNNLDYRASLNFSYFQNKISYFGGVSYTIVNDDDINKTDYKLNYQNNRSFYFGFGSHFIKKLYSSLSYASSSSIYKKGDDFNSISLYNHYNINQNWFTTFSYLYGISDNASDQFNLNMGYHF